MILTMWSLLMLMTTIQDSLEIICNTPDFECNLKAGPNIKQLTIISL